ncbi:MAG: diguanylate cyclase [Vicinamibacterales bacterium]
MAAEPIPLQPGGSRQSRPLVLFDVFDRLLTLIPELAPEVVAPDAETLRTDLAGYRSQLGETSDLFEIERLGGACVRACEAFLRRSRSQLGEREAEYLELIGLLRQAIDALAGGSKAFHGKLMASTSELADIAKLDDIRELKRRVLQEVEHIKQVTVERQREESAEYTKLTERVHTLESRLVRAQDEASRDPLSGIPNRGAFDRMLRHMLETKGKGDGRFVLGMVDIDNFKSINDTHGHLIGDRIIMCVAQHFAQALRASDFVARYGGEEFALLMTDIPLDTAKERLTAIRKKLAPSYQYERAGEQVRLSFTYSMGLAEFERGDTEQTLIRRADEALYEAKRKGKDCIVTKRSGFGGLRSLLRSS